MSDVDERIRTILDLGDSSGVVKALDSEIEKLIADFKKQTEDFEKGKLSSKEYTESLYRFKSGVSELRGAIDDLSKKAPDASAGLETLSRTMFALERGTNALISGTGLGRAANLLESVISFAKGPAGVGVALALVANTIDNVGPKIKAAWDRTWSIFSDEQIAAKRQELAEKAKGLREAIATMANAPAPGTEYQQAERDVKFRSIFNRETMTGPEGAQNKLYEAMRRNQGATPSDMTAEEKADIERAQDYIDPIGARKRAYERAGWVGAIGQFMTQPGPLEQLVHPYSVQEAKTKIQATLDLVARRSADQMIIQAQQLGPAGRTARKQLLNMAKRFPGILAPGDITKLEEIIKDETPHTKEAMEKEAEERAKAEAIEYKGPPPPVYPELREQGLPASRIPFGIIPGAGEHAEQLRLERERGARGRVYGPSVLPPELGGPRGGRYRRTQPYTANVEAQQAAYGEALKAAHQNILETLKLEQQGLKTHKQTQAIVHQIRRELNENKNHLREVIQNSGNLLREQQRSHQITTGHP